MTYRQVLAYGLIAGLQLHDMRHMKPGFIMDLYVYRRTYDDEEHRITRKKPVIYD